MVASASLCLALPGCGAREDPADRAADSTLPPPPRPGEPAPEIAGEDMDGKPFTLSEYRGKVVLVDFWGFWCAHCIRWIPHEKAMVRQFEGRPFVLLGVNTDRSRTEAQKYIFDSAINWRSWWDGSDSGPISTAWRVAGFPTFYLIDHRGVVQLRAYQITPEVYELIQRLVRDAEAAPAQ